MGVSCCEGETKTCVTLPSENSCPTDLVQVQSCLVNEDGSQSCPYECKSSGNCQICNDGDSNNCQNFQICEKTCEKDPCYEVDCNPPYGKCEKGECVCEKGYSGPKCKQPPPKSGCKTDSDCNSPYGQCEKGKCICEKGYSGPKCKQPTPKPPGDDRKVFQIAAVVCAVLAFVSLGVVWKFSEEVAIAVCVVFVLVSVGLLGDSDSFRI